MKRRLLLAALGLAVFGGLGCKRDSAKNYKELTLEQSVLAHKSGAAVFFDANTDDFRKENGKVPGAVLLSSSSAYDLSLLPAEKDKQLVFYCTSPV